VLLHQDSTVCHARTALLHGCWGHGGRRQPSWHIFCCNLIVVFCCNLKAQGYKREEYVISTKVFFGTGEQLDRAAAQLR